MKPLTNKQKAFALEILKGTSQRESYKIAYNAENMTKESIDVNAVRLVQTQNVADFIQAKRAKLELIEDNGRAKAVKTLWERYHRICATEVEAGNLKNKNDLTRTNLYAMAQMTKSSDATAIFGQIMKLMGWDKPKPEEGDHNVTIVIVKPDGA